MPRAKKKVEPTLEELVKAQVEEQLQEALLNIEFEAPQATDAFVDMDLLREEIKKEVEFAYKTKEHKEEVAKESKTELTRSELKLHSEREYNFVAGIDGLVINEKDNSLLTFSKSGAIGFGFKAPRTVGKGSAHFRANYPSEAPMPTTGKGSTRGVIVEGDGDDEKTFTFRALSRKNRQGFNVTGDGSVLIGAVEDQRRSKLSIYQNENDEPIISAYAPSKYFNDDMVHLQTAKFAKNDYTFIKGSVEVDQLGSKGVDVFKVDGTGSMFTQGTYFANTTGYAELFEWADKNVKNQNRYGFTVSLNNKGQIVDANEGDQVIGVVCSSAALVGHSAWNAWTHRFYLNSEKEINHRTVKIVEWEDEVGVTHSHFLDSLTQDFALPDNAVVYESDIYGNKITIEHVNNVFDKHKEYIPRLDRGWAIVVLTGRANVWKGQTMDNRWIKFGNVTDDIETWILK